MINFINKYINFINEYIYCIYWIQKELLKNKLIKRNIKAILNILCSIRKRF